MGKCRFQSDWQNDYKWLQKHKSDEHKAFCSICVKELIVKEGKTAVKKHGQSKIHIENEEKNLNSSTSVNTQKVNSSIENSFKIATEKSSKKEQIKIQALKAEALLVNSVSNHCQSETLYDCFTNLFPVMFPDSEVAKQMSIHRTKGGYILEHGIAPHYREKIVEQMRKYPFSINYDESTIKVHKTQQVNINVSIRNKSDLIKKTNYTTLKVEEGTSGKELVEMVFNQFELDSIDKKKMMSDKTDGCSAM